MRHAILLASAVLALAITASTFAGGNSTVSNPSFEFPDAPAGSYTEFSGGANFGGWSVTGTSVAVVDETFQEPGYAYPAAAGSQWLDLSGSSAGNGGVTQVVDLSPSTQYTLSWSIGNVSGGALGTDSSVLLFIDGQRVRRTTNSQDGTTMDWQRFSQDFVPSGSATQFEFRTDDPTNDQVNGLDDIRLVAGSAAPPAPEVGQTANAEAVRGQVLVQLTKGGPFVALSEAREIPIGATVDTTEGTVRLTTARNQAGEVQSGTFSAGLFQVLQSRKRRAKGLTELRMKGSAAGFRNCRAGGKRAASSALSKRTVRRLRANAKGRYRTRGRHSAATVRGTKWVQEDRCDGTLTRVKRGKVVVRDFRLKKTVTVSAGKSYLAKAAG